MDISLDPYKPANPKAPKFFRKTKKVVVHKYKKTLVLSKSPIAVPHAKFKATHKECNLNAKELSNVLKVFHQNMAKAALEIRAGVTLPNRMGKLQIMSYKRGKGQKINKWVSEKLGVEVHFNNLGGTFAMATVDVYSDSFNMINKDLWEFRAIKPFKEVIKAAMEGNRTRFVGATKSIMDHYRKEKFYKKEYAKKRDAELLLTYNEFEGLF